jgi:integrase
MIHLPNCSDIGWALITLGLMQNLPSSSATGGLVRESALRSRYCFTLPSAAATLMARNDIIGGYIRVAQDKARKGTTNELMIPIHPALARALKAGPVVGMQYLLTDVRGRPFRKLTQLIERAAELAGLPSRCKPHGLRKAALRRLAEHGSTTKEIAAVSGHRSLSEIERYTSRADQARLATSAVAKLPDENKT